MSNPIKFRTKFTPFLECEQGEAFWREKFAEFLKLSAEDASRLLFSLHMRKEEAIANKVSDSLYFEQWIERMPLSSMSFEDACTKLANEFTHQYRKHTDDAFLQRDIPDSMGSIFTKIEEATNKAVAVTVYDNCKAFLNIVNNDVQRALYLLRSGEESNYFGGIRNIGFTPEQAASLKRHHLLIAELLEKLSAEKMEELPTAIPLKSPHKKTTPRIPNSVKPSPQPHSVKPTAPTENGSVEVVALPLEFVIKNQNLLKELENYPWLISLLSKRGMSIPEVLQLLGEEPTNPLPSKELIGFLLENYEILKGHTPATLQAALASASDPAALQAVLAGVNDPAALQAAVLAALNRQ